MSDFGVQFDISFREEGEKRSLIKHMEDGNKNCFVLFGSQTGNAENLASRLAQEGKDRLGLRTEVGDLEEFDWEDLAQFCKGSILIFVLATYGEGEPTDNATEFYNYITEASGSTELKNVTFASFGLGNSTYENYNSVVRETSKALQRLGARPICTAGEGDDGVGSMEEDFLAWKEVMWEAVGGHFGLQVQDAACTAYSPNLQVIAQSGVAHEYSGVYLGEPNAQYLDRIVTSPYGPNNPWIAPVISCRELLGTKKRNCLHMEINLSESRLSYKTGDHVAIWPMNSNAEVDRFLRSKVPVPSPTTYDSVARYYLEIGSKISRQVVSILAEYAPCSQSREEMWRLGNDAEYFTGFALQNRLNIAQLLEIIGQGQTWDKIPFAIFLERLLRMQPRYYSISSSSLVHLEKISITAVVESLFSKARAHEWKGVATNYLLSIKRAQVDNAGEAVGYDLLGPRHMLSKFSLLLHIRPTNFKLPSDPSVPIIMVGAGTGVAPFRAFMQERSAQMLAGQQVGKSLLFYGCRAQSEDYIYAEEWEHYKSIIGDRFEIITAFSREKSNKVYVQHRLHQHQSIADLIIKQGGYIYVCGSAAHMGRAVGAAFRDILASHMQASEHEIEAFVRQMRADVRYQVQFYQIPADELFVHILAKFRLGDSVSHLILATTPCCDRGLPN
ncbi:hypothetical protein GGI35DRAFT_471116 [Trichoderma velutinum]